MKNDKLKKHQKDFIHINKQNFYNGLTKSLYCAVFTFVYGFITIGALLFTDNGHLVPQWYDIAQYMLLVIWIVGGAIGLILTFCIDSEKFK